VHTNWAWRLVHPEQLAGGGALAIWGIPRPGYGAASCSVIQTGQCLRQNRTFYKDFDVGRHRSPDRQLDNGPPPISNRVVAAAQ